MIRQTPKNLTNSDGFSPCPHRNAYQPEGTAVLSGALIFAIIVCNVVAAQFFHLVLR